MECPQHKIVSLTGNIAPDGSAAFYNVIFTHRRRGQGAALSRCRCRSSPPSRTRSALLLRSKPVIQRRSASPRRPTSPSSASASSATSAPLLQDGFITDAELQALQKAGAVGEIVGWAFDAEGRLIEGLTNDRVASVRPIAVARALAGRRASPWAPRRLRGDQGRAARAAHQRPDHR